MKHSPRKLKRGDIRSNTDAASYSRGLRYFQQGHVSSLSTEDSRANMVILHSVVRGSGTQVYKQEIYIESFDDGYTDIEGDCSCPEGFNCKHVVAACLAFQSNTPTDDAEPASKALSWLDAFTRDEQPAPQPGNEFIAYLLQPTSEAGVLEVRFVVTRLLKRGGLGKGRSIQLYNFAEDYLSPGYATDEDRAIGRLIAAQASHAWQQTALRGELGALALRRIAASGRGFWQGTGGPQLLPGAARELQPHWQGDANGDERLSLDIQPAALPLRTWPPLYLDPQNGELGPLQGTDVNENQWNLLLDAPPVSAAEAEKFSRRLVTSLPDTPLPPPRTLAVEELPATPPVPRLRLSGEQTPEGHHYHQMRLRFGYHGHTLPVLPAAPLSTLDQNDRILRIPRDLEAESVAVETLLDLGFVGVQQENNRDVVFISPVETTLMDSAARWERFLDETLPALQAEGWQVDMDPSFQLRFVDAGDWQAGVDDEDDSGNAWFNLHFDLDVDGQAVPLLPLISELLSHYEPDDLPETLTLPMGDHQYLRIPRERVQPVYQVLYELFDRDTLDDDGSLRLSRLEAARLAELDEETGGRLQWQGGEALRQLGRKLKDFQGIATVKPPKGLEVGLRHYQQQGLEWLQFLREYQLGGILADDMGLGKTVQTLAHLLLEKEQGRLDRPCLIVAPTSLMSNWRREAEQFAPALKVLVLQGLDRHTHFDEIGDHDLVLTTYPLLPRDADTLLQHRYHYLVLDEAQTIKNPRAKAARVVRQIDTRHRLCLTGTPMENHLGELWALFDATLPGLLGDEATFRRRFRTPIEKHGDEQQRQRLARRVAPFMLRRRKDEVAAELPAKTEIIRSVRLGSAQATLYESIRLSMEKRVREAIAAKGLARSHITVLDALLKLRQVCCDPALLSLPQAKKVRESAKLELLMDLLPEMVEEGRRILLFSAFAKMLGLIEKRLDEAGIGYSKLTGQTRKRDQAIERFRGGEVPVFLISLKAGGVGLNLTEADTVIHYDPWWNPAAENQATDRAHRIGQDKAVFVYKLLTENTVEERIIAMQERKQSLADGVYGRDEQDPASTLDAEMLQELLAPL